MGEALHYGNEVNPISINSLMPYNGKHSQVFKYHKIGSRPSRNMIEISNYTFSMVKNLMVMVSKALALTFMSNFQGQIRINSLKLLKGQTLPGY